MQRVDEKQFFVAGEAFCDAGQANQSGAAGIAKEIPVHRAQGIEVVRGQRAFDRAETTAFDQTPESVGLKGLRRSRLPLHGF